MKSGRSIQDFAIEIDRQNKSKRDFIVSAPKIKAYNINDDLELAFGLKDQPETDADFFAGKLTQTGHDHLGSFLGIPKVYYDRMRIAGNTQLLAQNAQWWLDKQSDRRMIRTLDGNVRGILSDKYRRLDNHDLLVAMLPILQEARATIEVCEITEKKLYVKFITHQKTGEIEKGDIVTLGGIISNSEIGFGSLNIQPLILRKVCNNGLILNDFGYKKYHVGRKAKEDVFEMTSFSNETNAALDKAFWLQIRDVIKQTLDDTTLEKAIKSMQKAAGMKIVDAQVAMEITKDKFGLNESESDSVLNHLISGGDLSNWGMLNAVTAAAQTVDSFDRSVELETLASQLLSLSLNRN